MSQTNLFTIGFTHKTAQQFFETLRQAHVRRVIDVRLNNTSQLSGFSKKPDLQYFLAAIGQIEYVHLPELSPTREMLAAYKKHGGSWQAYQEAFLELMAQRRIELSVPQGILNQSCLLCSEDNPSYCHRGLVVHYLGQFMTDLHVRHL